MYIDIWSNSTSFSLGVKIVVLFRSDVFAGNRGRNKNSKPGPGVVFDIVNETIARKLGREPLTFPSTADAMQAWLHAFEEGLFLKRVRSAPTRVKSAPKGVKRSARVKRRALEPSKLNPKRLRFNRKTHEADVLDGSGS